MSDKKNNQQYSLVTVSIFSSIYLFMLVSICLTVVLWFLQYNRPVVKYYVADINNDKNYISVMDEPSVSPDAILKWATIVAIQSNSTDFYNFEKNLEELKPNFTKAGYRSYLDEIANVQLEKDIKQKSIVMSAVSTSKAVIIQELEDSWLIQVPLLVTWQGASEYSTKKYLASNLYVVKVSTDVAVKGIGINQVTQVNNSTLPGTSA